jgi:hypothetical protein
VTADAQRRVARRHDARLKSCRQLVLTTAAHQSHPAHTSQQAVGARAHVSGSITGIGCCVWQAAKRVQMSSMACQTGTNHILIIQ